MSDGLVGRACHRPAMRILRGIELRYLLTWHLFLCGPATITELVSMVEHHGFCVASPAPKSVSDALRWERRRGRVRRLGRAVYGPGEMPRGTEHRMHRRVLALRAEGIAQRRAKWHMVGEL